MLAGIYHGPRDVRMEDVPDPRIEAPTDAVVRITHACICGSDLWFYRGTAPWEPGWRTGHEWMGVVEDVGPDVTTLKKGDRVVAPFTYSDGSCPNCAAGLPTSCLQGGAWGGSGGDGGQAEAIRAPFADATLVKLPPQVEEDAELLRRILPLTDVMSTGHHAAVSAGVGKGSTVLVVGDGAVGLCGVAAARRLGAERIIAAGHHDARLEIARQMGATDTVDSAGENAVKEIRELAGRGGPECVLECVGAESSMALATRAVRPGGTVGHVGVPYGSGKGLDLGRLFAHNITLRGGVAPVRNYLDELLADVLAGTLDPSPVLDRTVALAEVPAGYEAMDQRTAIKVAIEV